MNDCSCDFVPIAGQGIMEYAAEESRSLHLCSRSKGEEKTGVLQHTQGLSPSNLKASHSASLLKKFCKIPSVSP